jgi:hypothetical protein
MLAFNAYNEFLPWSSESSEMYCRVPKSMSTSIWEHGSKSQKTLNFILAAVRTWNLTDFFHVFIFSYTKPKDARTRTLSTYVYYINDVDLTQNSGCSKPSGKERLRNPGGAYKRVAS